MIHTSLPHPNARIRLSNRISRRMGGDSFTLGCGRGNGRGILLRGRVWAEYAEYWWECFGHYGDLVGRRGCRAGGQAREEALELEEVRERV